MKGWQKQFGGQPKAAKKKLKVVSIWGCNITTNPLTKKSLHLELDGDNVETATKMTVVINLSDNKILPNTPKEGEDEGVSLSNNPRRHGNQIRHIPDTRQS